MERVSDLTAFVIKNVACDAFIVQEASTFRAWQRWAFDRAFVTTQDRFK
jgi:hypothetical protein